VEGSGRDVILGIALEFAWGGGGSERKPRARQSVSRPIFIMGTSGIKVRALLDEPTNSCLFRSHACCMPYPSYPT
jgi:hypothetical protein